MHMQWLQSIRASLKRRARYSEIRQKIFWMVSWELQELEKLKEGLDAASRIQSIYLSPGSWLTVANPAVVELGKLVDFTKWKCRLDWAIDSLHTVEKGIKIHNSRCMIEYLDERLKLMNTRFKWASHHERDVGPKEAVEAKFETESELRSMIVDLQTFHEQESGCRITI